MAVDPIIVQAEQKYRAALGAGDANSRKALFKAYSGAFKKITADLTAITAKIDAARLAGEPISAAWLMQQDRYRSLQGQVATLSRDLTVALGTHLPADQAAAAKAAEQLVGVHSGPVFTKLPASAVEGVVGTTTSGSPLRNLLDTFNSTTEAEASQYLRSRLVAGIASGQSPVDLASVLAAGVQSLTLSRALTISRTETNRALRRATTLSIKANLDLIAGWVWRSAADERTCPACFSLHGTFFPGATPMRAHVNCRCVMIPKRIVKNDPYGFGGAVKVGNGADLFKSLPAESQLRILGKGRYELYKSGKITLNQTRVLRNNPTWGPSYQVKPLKDIKAELDNPPPPPKPKAPKPTPPAEPTGAPSFGSVVDEVSEAEKAIAEAPKAVPVASKPIPATAIQKAEAKVAAHESRLVEIEEAEQRITADIPHMSHADAVRWRRGEYRTDVHMISVDELEWNHPDRNLFTTSVRKSYASDYVPGVGDEIWYQSVKGGGNTWTVFRTRKEFRVPYSVEAQWIDPAFRMKVYRALPSQSADIELFLSKNRVTKALADAKIALERALNPDTTVTKKLSARPAPREITPEEAYKAQESARATLDEFARSTVEHDSVEDFIYGSGTYGTVDLDAMAAYRVKIGVTGGEVMPGLVSDPLLLAKYNVKKTGSFVHGDTMFTAMPDPAITSGTKYFMTRLKPGAGPQVEAYLARTGLGKLTTYGPEWQQWVAAPDEVLWAIKTQAQIEREYSAWWEYDTIRKVGKKPIEDVPVGLGGSTAPIPSSSTFAGAPRKWTLRGDKAGDLYGNPTTFAKDTTNYKIARRLREDPSFIDALVDSDNLGEWIKDAGRSTRPGVARAADQWRNWSKEERRQFLATGSLEPGYFKWTFRETRAYNEATGGYELTGYEAVRGGYVTSVEEGGYEFIYDLSTQMVQQWAGTSGDSHILSVGLQKAAMEEFGLGQTSTLSHFAGRHHQGGFGVESGELLGAVDAFYSVNGPVLRRFLRAMYEETQEELALAGISTVRAVRGVGSVTSYTRSKWAEEGLEAPAVGREQPGWVDLQPMSSFAVDTKTAKRFGGTLYYVDVPASWVIGTCRTGFGCLNEYEWVMLGGNMKATVFNGRRW